MTPGNLPTRHYGFFILAMLIMVGLVGYLGFRAIEHEALLKRYQSEELAQERIGQAQGVVTQLLENRASRLQSAAAHMQLDDAWLKALIDSDADIDGIFIIDRHGLLYPAVSYPSGTGTLNAQEQRLVDLVVMASQRMAYPLTNWQVVYYG